MDDIKILNSLEEAVNFYSEHFNYNKEFEFIKKCLDSNILDHSKAAILVYGIHQYRISNYKKDELNDILENYKPWNKKFLDFEDIYSKVSTELYPFKGRVTLYDIPFRLVIALNLLPEKYVYITSGKVIENAKKILGVYKDPGIKRPKTDFPLPLQKLESHQIEDFLCEVDIEDSLDGHIFKFKERCIKPFSKYPADVMKEIKTLWEQVYNQKLKTKK